MLIIRGFVAFAVCVIMGMFSHAASAQTGSADADDWAELKSRYNIFALRNALEHHLDVSDGVRSLAVAYVGAFSRDFEIADQRLAHARRYARARGDVVLGHSVEGVANVLLREQGRFQALSERLKGGPHSGGVWEQRVKFWSDALTSAFVDADDFTMTNISPDGDRIILPVSFGDTGGTMLFDTGAEETLLSSSYADKYHVTPSGIRFSMLTIDGPRDTELGRISDLVFGAARFGGISVGIQTQTDGVIGFYLNKGATGIMGYPLISRFGKIDFFVEGGRVERLTFHRSDERVRDGVEPNVIVREDKPYVKVRVNGEIYSCIFDTGAPRSLFSSAIINRHAKALGLNVLSKKQARKSGLSAKDNSRYVQLVPLHAGRRDLELENVYMVETSGSDREFCLIGLDAVIKSGGARFDMDSLKLVFGRHSAQTHLFGLR